jgi:uncharacterized protein
VRKVCTPLLRAGAARCFKCGHMLARMTHVETVSEIYAAFGRGDVAAILERVSDDVRWEHWADWFPHRDGIDHLATRSGRDGV